MIAIFEKYNDLKKISISRGGDCLGYDGKKFIFICKFKHKWKARYWHIKKDKTWCPECASGLYERIVRYHFESLFKHKFPKVRPKWLKNPKTGKSLELDGYCKELNLAFEHNGTQHYYKIDKYKYYNLDKIQYKDKIKKNLCKLNNTTLIVIPELFAMINLKDLKCEIKKQCIEQNFKIPNNYDDIIINFNNAYFGLEYENLKKFEKFKQECIDKNIKIHCKKYITSVFNFKAECLICKTIWETSYNRIKSGKGCPKCAKKRSAKKRTYNYSFVKNFIEEKGYKLISKEYVNCKKHLIVKCKFCKNNWNITFDNFKRGYRCPRCVNKNIGKNRSSNPIEEIQKYCKDKNGICIDAYKGYNKRYKCVCEQNHIFYLYWKGPRCTRRYGSWCDECKKGKNGKNNNDDGDI